MAFYFYDAGQADLILDDVTTISCMGEIEFETSEKETLKIKKNASGDTPTDSIAQGTEAWMRFNMIASATIAAPTVDTTLSTLAGFGAGGVFSATAAETAYIHANAAGVKDSSRLYKFTLKPYDNGVVTPLNADAETTQEGLSYKHIIIPTGAVRVLDPIAFKIDEQRGLRVEVQALLSTSTGFIWTTGVNPAAEE